MKNKKQVTGVKLEVMAKTKTNTCMSQLGCRNAL
jgi:hypothetical protein